MTVKNGFELFEPKNLAQICNLRTKKFSSVAFFFSNEVWLNLLRCAKKKVLFFIDFGLEKRGILSQIFKFKTKTKESHLESFYSPKALMGS